MYRFGVDEDVLSVICWYSLCVVQRQVYGKSATSFTNEVDKGEGCKVMKILWLCGEFGVDDALGRDFCCVRALLCNGVGRTGFNKGCIYACPLGVTSLVEDVSCMWGTCDKVDSSGEVVIFLYIVQGFQCRGRVVIDVFLI